MSLDSQCYGVRVLRLAHRTQVSAEPALDLRAPLPIAATGQHLRPELDKAMRARRGASAEFRQAAQKLAELPG